MLLGEFLFLLYCVWKKQLILFSNKIHFTITQFVKILKNVFVWNRVCLTVRYKSDFICRNVLYQTMHAFYNFHLSISPSCDLSLSEETDKLRETMRWHYVRLRETMWGYEVRDEEVRENRWLPAVKLGSSPCGLSYCEVKIEFSFIRTYIES